jgi:two-component system chemotaxis response regulator CheB
MDGLRVLIVDDSITIRAMIEEIIAHAPGCRVVGVASDVAAARDLIRTARPNLITLDLAMPGIDGIAFLDELASRAHAPVVVISSSTSDGAEAARDAIAHGAEACFDKTRLISEAGRLLRLLRDVAKRTPLRMPRVDFAQSPA